MTETLTISEARKRFTKLPEEFARKPRLGAVKITRRKEPVMALMPWELYESLIETMDVMADERLMRALRDSLADIKAGRVLTLDEVAERLELDR
jgi:PHD/YefM family antitoxin component YafN of YafNO toxin-antitoxin module